MRSRNRADTALVETAARLVVRLIETPGMRAEQECKRWATCSPRHMAEILRTLCEMKNLDALGILAVDGAVALSSWKRSACTDLKPPAIRKAAPRSRVPRGNLFGNRSGKADHLEEVLRREDEGED